MGEDRQRIYSQNMTGSQITLSPTQNSRRYLDVSSQNYSEENSDNMLQENSNFSEDESQDNNDEYDFQTGSSHLQDISCNNQEIEIEESNKIEEICEENRQLGSTIASSIENFEKCRISLSNDLMNTEDQLKLLYEKHEQQLAQLLDTQMKLEEDTDTYMKELENRPLLKDKAAHNNIIAKVLKEHYDAVIATLQECKTQNINIKKEILSGTKLTETMNEKFQNKYQNFKEELENLISQTTNLKSDIVNGRKIQEEKIEEGKLLLINTSKKVEQLENELSECIEYKNQLNTSCNTLTAEIEASKKSVALLQEQIMHLKSTAAKELHYLKLKKENQDTMLTSYTSVSEVRKGELLVLSNKEKEMQGLSEQLKGGINEVSQRNRKLAEKNEEIVQNVGKLNKKEEDLVNKIKELNLVEKHNKSLIQNIDALKLSIDNKKLRIENTKEKICQSEVEFNKLKNMLAEKQLHIESLREEKLKLKTMCESKTSELSVTTKAIQEKKNAFENLLSEWKNKNKEIHNKIARNKTELQNISMNVQALKTEKININQQINSIKIQIEQTEDNFKWKKKDLQFNLESYTDILQDEEEDLDKNEDDLVNIKMELEEMSGIEAQKAALDLDLQYQSKSWHEQRDRLVSDFNNKLKEKDREMAIYKASFQGIFEMEEKKTLKFSEQIRESELKKKELESEFKDLFTQLKEAREKETEKRNTIVELEKALRSVTEAAKVTQQDIKRAISSPKKLKKDTQKPGIDDDGLTIMNKGHIIRKATVSSAPLEEMAQQKKARTGLMTPSSSLDSCDENTRKVFSKKGKK